MKGPQMRHHSASIVGPDIDDLSTKGNPPPIDNDYPSDLLAAIPWAKEASLRLVEAGHVSGYGKWIYVMPSHYYNAHTQEWTMMRGMKVEGMFGYYPTRAAALKSPPPKPPGFGEARAPDSPTLTSGPQMFTVSGIPKGNTVHISANPAQPSVGDKLGEIMLKESNSESWEQVGESVRRPYRRQALAVRREVLREGFTDEDIQAARREHERQWGTGGTSPSFCMKHALSAALASRVARESKVTP